MAAGAAVAAGARVGWAERGRWLGAVCCALALHAGMALALLSLARDAPPAELPEPVFLVMLEGPASSQPAAIIPAPPPPPAEASEPEPVLEPETPTPVVETLPDFDLPDPPPAEDVLVHIPPRASPPLPKRPVARPRPAPPRPIAQPLDSVPVPPVAENPAQVPATESATLPVAPAASGPPAAAPQAAAIPGAPSKAELDWRARLLGHLERHKRYPAEARSYHQEGVVHLHFVMERNGQVREARIDRSSGYPLLDAEALAMLKRATPLPPFPPDIEPAELRLAFPLRFALK